MTGIKAELLLVEDSPTRNCRMLAPLRRATDYASVLLPLQGISIP